MISSNCVWTIISKLSSEIKDTVIVIALSVAIIQGWVALRKLTKDKFLDMRNEYDKEGIELRRIFWNGLRKSYKIHIELYDREVLSEECMDIIVECGIPPGITECQNIRLYKLENGTDIQRYLYNFVNWLYDENYTGLLIDNQLNISKDKTKLSDTEFEKLSKEKFSLLEFEEFLLARSKLSAFWERWTERLNSRWNFNKLSKLYAKERHCLIILSWLDIANRKDTKEDHQGKQSMYKLAKKMIKTSNKPKL